MLIYRRLFLGFYCLIQRMLPKENKPENFATALLSGSVSFIFFSASIYFLQYAASIFETILVFVLIYAIHHIIFIKDDKYKAITDVQPCTDRWIYRSLLFLFAAVSLFMFISTKVAIAE